MSHTTLRRRVMIAGATLSVVGLALTGCSAGSQAGAGSTKYAAVIKGLDNPFFQSMENGIKDSAKSDDASVSVQAAQDVSDTTGQAEKLSAMAGQDYGCFIVNPISGTNLVQALAPVSQANKPIVNIDQPIESDAAKAANLKISTYIGTDNVSAGESAGKFMTEKVAGGSSVAVIGGVAGDVTSAARIKGFESAAGSKVKVVDTVAGNWVRETALTAATNILQANPDVKGFFVANDDMGLGVVKAVENAGLTGKVVVVSVDGTEDGLKSVQSGGLSASVAQYPYEIGKLGVEACKAVAAGKSVPKNITSPTALVTKDNAEEAISAFPKPFEKFEDPIGSGK